MESGISINPNHPCYRPQQAKKPKHCRTACLHEKNPTAVIFAIFVMFPSHLITGKHTLESQTILFCVELPVIKLGCFFYINVNKRKEMKRTIIFRTTDVVDRTLTVHNKFWANKEISCTAARCVKGFC